MKILIIGAHADDPETCMGGTIRHFVNNGHEVKELVAVSDYELRPTRTVDECIKAAKLLGCELGFINLDRYTISFNRDLVQLLDKKITDYKPDMIFTNWDGDSHQDHVAIAKATVAATRKNDTSLFMYRQLLFGGITPDVFRGSVYVDISDTLTIKLAAIRQYKSQQPIQEQIDAIKGIARFNGAMIGVKYAEVFQPVRVLWKGLCNG